MILLSSEPMNESNALAFRRSNALLRLETTPRFCLAALSEGEPPSFLSLAAAELLRGSACKLAPLPDLLCAAAASRRLEKNEPAPMKLLLAEL